MIVCAHGDVREFCEAHDMIIIEDYVGEIEKYDGLFRVLVTAEEMSEHEYYFLKGKMLNRGYELVCIHRKDERTMVELMTYKVIREAEERREKYGGRHMFGMNGDGLTETGRVVVARIFELRDKNYTLRQISEDADVHKSDGSSLSISTIQTIIKNRGKYEEIGL